MGNRAFVQIIIAASIAAVVGTLAERWLKNRPPY